MEELSSSTKKPVPSYVGIYGQLSLKNPMPYTPYLLSIFSVTSSTKSLWPITNARFSESPLDNSKYSWSIFPSLFWSKKLPNNLIALLKISDELGLNPYSLVGISLLATI